MNTRHSEQSTSNDAESVGRELLEVNHASQEDRAYGIDGWIVLTDNNSSDTHGLLVARQYALAQSATVDGAQVKRVVLRFAAEELDGFRFACEEAARAEQALSNPLVGLKHYRAAVQSFPFLPELNVLHSRLLASAKNVVAMALQSADECLKDRRTWAAAHRPLEKAKSFIEAEDALHMDFAVRFELLQSTYTRVAKLLPHGRRALPQHPEHDVLRDLRNDLADDPNSYWHMTGWRSVRERLAQLEASAQQKQHDEWLDARRRFAVDVSRAYNDASAINFLEQFAQVGNAPPSDKDIAALQLNAADALLRKAQQMARVPEVARLMDDDIRKLEGWRRDLGALIGGLALAKHRAELGLRDPDQFDVARYVLGIGVRKPATTAQQVPQMFVGHPSLLQCKAQIEANAARRASQVQLAREIAVCLQFDAATAPEHIAAQGTEPFLHILRGNLRDKTAAIYPIETAWDKLREMARGEPDDACGLQHALVYHDSDDYGREHLSVAAISAVIQRKVRQVHVLRQWLHTFTHEGHARHADAFFPGAVNWPQEKSAIENLRDSGPHGLAEAQALCNLARSGGNDGKVNGLLSLERMCHALSPASMFAYMREQLAVADPSAIDLPLCAAAQALNLQRHELWLAYDRQLRECDTLTSDIAARIERYVTVWDAFEHSYHALMALPIWRRRHIAQSAEWQAFQDASAAFFCICPNDDVFRAKLEAVKARYKLQPECLDGEAA